MATTNTPNWWVRTSVMRVNIFTSGSQICIADCYYFHAADVTPAVFLDQCIVSLLPSIRCNKVCVCSLFSWVVGSHTLHHTVAAWNYDGRRKGSTPTRSSRPTNSANNNWLSCTHTGFKHFRGLLKVRRDSVGVQVIGYVGHLFPPFLLRSPD